MALKTKVRADQVVSNEDGTVEWITDSGQMMKSPAAEVSIVEEAAPATAEQEAPEDEAPASEEAAAEPEEEAPPAKPPAKKKATIKKEAAKPEKVFKKVTKIVVAPATPPVSETKTPTKAAKPSKPEEKTVAKAKAKAKSTAKGARTIGGKEVDLSKYNKVKAPGGGVSFNNGDSTAKKLEGKSLDDVYKIVAKDTKQDEKALKAKYKHLNPGMQRMALGNMHRKGPREEKKAKS